METKTNYTVGEYSRRYLDALNSFQGFKSTFYDALVAAYGEKTGDEMYHEHDTVLDAVERVVLDYMRYQFTLEMGTGKTEITI